MIGEAARKWRGMVLALAQRWLLASWPVAVAEQGAERQVGHDVDALRLGC